MARVYGGDPEFFLSPVADKYNDIRSVFPPAALFEDYGIPFSINENNKKVIYKGNTGLVIEDGAAIELNLSPATLASDYYFNITSLLQDFEDPPL